MRITEQSLGFQALATNRSALRGGGRYTDSRTLTTTSPEGTESAKVLATIDVIKSGAHMTKARALYSLSNATTVKQADRVQHAIDPLVAGEMEREN